MNAKSEQLTKNGTLEFALDARLSSRETLFILKKIFGEELYIEKICGKKVFVSKNGEKKTILLISQISYLGNPHPLYKKRVQLKNWFMDILDYTYDDFTYDVKLIGIYRYKDNVLFVDFDKEKYMTKKMHNSSAHVYVNDLFKGLETGTFSKRDKNNNLITVIRPDFFKSYIFNGTHALDEYNQLLELIDSFNKNHFVFNKWIEVNYAVQEMKDNNFSKWKECEWAGFFLEFKFSYYTIIKKIEEYVKYMNNTKKDLNLDFDLKFEKANFYGDLKSSSIKELSTMLNDAENILYEIEQYGKLWYLIYEHDTIKDKDLKDFPYTKKRLQVIRRYEPNYKKGEDLSYSTRLKAKVNYKKMYIVEINKINYGSLLEQMTSNFHQPNHGATRKPKFKITKQNIQNAIIYSYNPENNLRLD